MKELIAKDRISQQQFDAAVAAADAARASRDAASAAVSEAEKGVSAAEARLAQARTGVDEARAAVEGTRSAPEQVSMSKSNAASAEARVLQARAALDRAQLDLDYTKVKAPVSGIVSMKKVEIGQVVQKEQPLMAVVPLDDIWVTANYKENQLINMRVGQHAIISIDAYGGRKYRGYVQSIAAATGARFSLLPPENATGNYVKVVQRIPVKVLLDQGQDSEHLLRPGMSVVPTVFTN
jgi:membrane fusion protein (multidrug efflux system)